MDDRTVITKDHLLEVIIRILEKERTEMTPSSIKAVVHSRKLLPWKNDLSDRIYDVMQTSYEEQENIFYLSQKGKRRFGLIRWRVSEEKTALAEAIRGLDEFTTAEFRVVYLKTLDAKKRKQMHVYLRELREDGVIERVKTGVYRRK